MPKIWCTLLMLGSFAATVNAAPLDAPPPYAGDSETVRETLPPPKVVLEKKSPEEGRLLVILCLVMRRVTMQVSSNDGHSS